MLRNRRIYITALTLLGLIPVQGILFSQKLPEYGRYPVYNFSSKTYNAQEQNFAIAFDNRGLAYFTNLSGVLEYDGINWRLIPLVNEKVPRSLATDKYGRIWVGSENEIGYLASDSVGKMNYVSIRKYLPPDIEDFQQVWNVYTKENEVIFQTYNFLFIWNREEMKVVPSSSRIIEFFKEGDDFFASIKGTGLSRFDGKLFSLIPGGNFFANKLVYGIIGLDSIKLLIATEKEGLFILDRNTDIIKPFKTQADKYLGFHGIFNLAKLGNDNISIGTWGGGLVIINDKGEIQNIIDKEYGLQDQIIFDQKTDGLGNIWLALSKGISRIEILSPVSLFTSLNGLQGTVQSITSFHGEIYAASTVGVYYLTHQIKELNGDNFNEPVFKVIDKLPFECWDLLDFTYNGNEELLVLTNNDIKKIDKNHQISKIQDAVSYDIYQSKLDPARVYIGLEDGLSSVYFEKGNWNVENKIQGIDATISSITEDQLGNLWMGTIEQGIVKMNIKSFHNNRIKDFEVLKFDTLNGLPTGPTLVSNISGRIVIGTSKGLFKFSIHRGSFEPDSSFGTNFADGSHYIHRINDQKNQKTWIVTVNEKSLKNKYHVGIMEYSAGMGNKWITQPFSRISENIQHSIFQAEDGIVWIGGPDGIYRYDPGMKKKYDAVYHTLIRNVTQANGEVLFGGTGYDINGVSILFQPSQINPILPYNLNSLSFDFAAQSGENESFLNFSYLLEGYDKKWSDWSSQSKKEYTNLNEGSYIFRVKSKNIYGNQGTEASFTFTILSPWYRTFLAYFVYVIFLVFLILGIVKVYTRSLRKIIHDRTAEVVRQKTEIEVKSKEITDSIHYASRIQSAILPPEEYLSTILSDFFILYMPRDIVSGDFYWMHSENGRLITVTADCTGHGVPGAFMSMLGVAFLNEIVIRHEGKSADTILNELRAYVIKSLRQTGKEGENQDGMDLSLCIYDINKMKAQFAGANNPLLLVRNEEIIIYPADNMPVGIHRRSNVPFKLHEIDLRKGDIFYTLSDGFVDQFGGPEGKKFMMKRLKEMLLSIHDEPMKKQKEKLLSAINEWMKDSSQIDDILLMGIKI
jgi:serine phosphatase RsbU (regulator of sigma subunit)/ligand-binding sensor domain-containing protein